MDGLAEALSRGPKLLAVAHVSNVLGTLNPLPEISRMAHDAGALVVADGAQAAPKLAVDVAELGVDFYALTGHKAYAPTGIGALWGRLDLLRAMEPFLGGGSMIRKVTKQGTTWADVPARFEAGTPAIAQAIGLAAAIRWLDGIGMDHVTAHEREITAYAMDRLAGVPGLDDLRSAREPRPGRPRLVRARGRPRPRRLGDPRPPRRGGARRPPLRAAADGAPRRRRDGARELRDLHDAPRRSTAWSRASRTPARFFPPEQPFGFKLRAV